MKAAGEIYLSVGAEQKQHLKECLDDPVKMWTTLEKTHVSKKPGARFNAYDELFSIVKLEEESLQSLGDRVVKIQDNNAAKMKITTSVVW